MNHSSYKTPIPSHPAIPHDSRSANPTSHHDPSKVFVYASLLARQKEDGTELSGVLSDLGEETVATAMFMINLCGFVVCAYFGWRRREARKLNEMKVQNAMAEVLLKRQARQGSSRHKADLQTLQDFTPFALVPKVSILFKALDAHAARASKQVREEEPHQREERKKEYKRLKELEKLAGAHTSKHKQRDEEATQKAVKLLGAEKATGKSKKLLGADGDGTDVYNDPDTFVERSDSKNWMLGFRSPNLMQMHSSNRQSSVSSALGDDDDAVSIFRTKVGEAHPTLIAQIDAFCSQKGVIRKCDAVIATAESGGEAVYLAVW